MGLTTEEYDKIAAEVSNEVLEEIREERFEGELLNAFRNIAQCTAIDSRIGKYYDNTVVEFITYDHPILNGIDFSYKFKTWCRCCNKDNSLIYKISFVWGGVYTSGENLNIKCKAIFDICCENDQCGINNNCEGWHGNYKYEAIYIEYYEGGTQKLSISPLRMGPITLVEYIEFLNKDAIP